MNKKILKQKIKVCNSWENSWLRKKDPSKNYLEEKFNHKYSIRLIEKKNVLNICSRKELGLGEERLNSKKNPFKSFSEGCVSKEGYF